MKKAIVTGANGFVGHWLVKKLVKNDIYVYAVVRDENSQVDSIKNLNNVKIVYCDLENISKLDNIITDRDIDVFYHFAWNGSAGNARVDERLQMNNVLWTVDSVRVASKIRCKKFVGAGSVMEKESLLATYTQGNAPGMAYIYGDAKIAAHCISKSVAGQLGIEHIWAMITNAYGEGELSPRFVNTTIRKIINNDSLQFTSAAQNYDFVHISDVARAFFLIGENGKNNCEYIIGSSNAKPLKEFIIELQQALAPDKELLFGNVPFTGINMPLENFDTSHTENDTGFRAKISFGEGVKRTMEWLELQEEIVL